MSLSEEATHTISRLLVEAFPEEVDAAGDLKLKARVSSSPALDLRGLALLVRDHKGAAVGTALLAEFDGEINETAEIVLKVPAKVGTYSWSVVFPASAFDGIKLEEVSEPFSISVKPHATRIVVWDVPSTVAIGSKFRFKVGLKSSSEGRLEGRELTIHDSEGAQIAAGRLGGDIWRGTAALYFVEIELDAPSKKGLAQIEVRAPAAHDARSASGMELPHAEASSKFGIQVVPQPDVFVRMEVTDKDTKMPLKGATVVLHPYRAVTDERGMAELRMSKGQYKLQVSKAKYLARVLPLEVLSDLATTTELVLEPNIDPNELLY